MTDLPLDPAGYTWRPLRRKDPMQRGWDVFELQTRLAALGAPIACDGWFGDQTASRVWTYQTEKGLVVDGIAGVMTQVHTALACAAQTSLPQRVHGQIEKESSGLVGVYSPQYPNGSVDRGAVQENSKYHPDTQAAFDIRQSLPVLIKEINSQHDKYVSQGVGDNLAWAAAQGHWNSPLYADRYAKGEAVPTSFESYIAAVTAYV